MISPICRPPLFVEFDAGGPLMAVFGAVALFCGSVFLKRRIYPDAGQADSHGEFYGDSYDDGAPLPPRDPEDEARKRGF